MVEGATWRERHSVRPIPNCTSAYMAPSWHCCGCLRGWGDLSKTEEISLDSALRWK